jgi:pimeloyl-ACP methyl ester carboxylesterase
MNIAEVYYESHGTGLPIVMLHGYGLDHRMMKGCMEPLLSSRPGWRRIYLDLPGMGRTPAMDPVRTSDDMLTLVLEVIDHLLPDGQPFVVAGQSYGGYLAQGIVHRRPQQVAGVMLLCPAVIPDRARRQLPDHHQVLVPDPALLAELSPAEAERFNAISVVQSRPIWERTAAEIFSGVDVADEPYLERLQQTGYAFSVDLYPLPAPCTAPTLLLAGSQDSGVGYRDLFAVLENYPRATFAALDLAGHHLQVEQAGLFNALVSEWLQRVESSR